jgi:hypothetical protein
LDYDFEMAGRVEEAGTEPWGLWDFFTAAFGPDKLWQSIQGEESEIKGEK